MTGTSREAGRRGHRCFMSKARVHFGKVTPPSRWKGEAGVTVRKQPQPPIPSGLASPPPMFRVFPDRAPGSLLQPDTSSWKHTILVWEGELRQSVCGGGGPSKALSSGGDTACRKPWARGIPAQSLTSAEDSGDGPRATT